MNTEVYEKSFFEKKIVIKNEIIYYFEDDDLKEAIYVEKFDKAGTAEKTRGGQGALRAPCGEAGCAQSGGFAGVGELASGGV